MRWPAIRDRLTVLLLWLIASLVLIAAWIALLLAALISPCHRYTWNMLVSCDQLGNSVIAGDPDETISSRAAKRVGKCTACRYLCSLLNHLQPGHCAKAIEPDEGKAEVWRG